MTRSQQVIQQISNLRKQSQPDQSSLIESPTALIESFITIPKNSRSVLDESQSSRDILQQQDYLSVSRQSVDIPQSSAFAGLFFLLPLMTHLRIKSFLESNPHLIEFDLPRRLLNTIAQRLEIPETDPVWEALTKCSNNCSEAVLLRSWLNSMRRWCRLNAEMGLHNLVSRSGQVLITRTLMFGLNLSKLIFGFVASGWISIRVGCPGLGELLRFTTQEQGMEIENSANRPIVTLHTFAFAAIAATLDPALLVNPTAPELQHLCHYQAIATADQFHWVNALKIYLRHPAARDYSLLRLAKSLSLTIVEVLAISLSIAVEQDPIAGRILAYLQAPLGGSRPTLGLLSSAFSPLPHSVSVIDRLMIGNAIASGLLQLLNESAPLPEQSIKVPLHLGLALREHVIAAAWTGEGVGLDALAQPLTDAIPDNALVMTPALRDELQMLFLRCRHRDRLVTGLGLSATVRYHPGVRSLFVGASGTGKTLAAGWLATKLGMPLYRVDLASITSKYIGETEKNLSQLLSRAEQAEVVLLFDEADSLFGKRTEVQQANDRFANAQTNYLLQRIESFDGITAHQQ
ncbi:ATP-binding protein [Phormidesmis priestleyi]|uniref:ATP-binding protein n=1 Tax=Phormidesmis priestleyi TaxID=268141 RepID=UPI000932BCC7|nr:ATP-binding protein [Phormidesmis priestleyi]